MLGPPASLWEVGFPRLRQDYQKPGDPAWNSPDLCAPDEVHTAGLGRGPGRVRTAGLDKPNPLITALHILRSCD